MDSKTDMEGGGSRKAPEIEAKLMLLGTKKTGVDGKTWMVVKTSSGVKRWQRVSSKKSAKRSSSKKEKRSYTRKVPKTSASDLKIGTRRKGADGFMYQVKKGLFGKKWEKVEEATGTSGRKYRTLRALWERLSKGEMIILIMRDGTIKPVRRYNAMRVWNKVDENDKVEAVLTSSVSETAFKRFYERAKGNTVEEVLRNYKKFFNQRRVVSDKDWVM